MPTLVFNLRGVPEDEAEDVRNLLTEQRIDFYETPAGKWGISVPAIWVHDDADAAVARQGIEAYESERAARAREAYRRRKAAGEAESLADRIKRRPLEVLGALCILLVVLYFSTRPFIDFGR